MLPRGGHSHHDPVSMIGTLEKFEYRWLQLPRPTKTLYLDLPPAFALQAMQADGTRKELDLHEQAGLDYKNKVCSC